MMCSRSCCSPCGISWCQGLVRHRSRCTPPYCHSELMHGHAGARPGATLWAHSIAPEKQTVDGKLDSCTIHKLMLSSTLGLK